jgi:hypothetical protein
LRDKWVPILASEYKVQVLMMKILAIVENNFLMLSLGFDVESPMTIEGLVKFLLG